MNIYIYSDVKIYNDLVFGMVGLGKIDLWNEIYIEVNVGEGVYVL